LAVHGRAKGELLDPGLLGVDLRAQCLQFRLGFLELGARNGAAPVQVGIAGVLALGLDAPGLQLGKNRRSVASSWRASTWPALTSVPSQSQRSTIRARTKGSTLAQCTGSTVPVA
jgi:hypothetical protein